MTRGRDIWIRAAVALLLVCACAVSIHWGVSESKRVKRQKRAAALEKLAGMTYLQKQANRRFLQDTAVEYLSDRTVPYAERAAAFLKLFDNFRERETSLQSPVTMKLVPTDEETRAIDAFLKERDPETGLVYLDRLIEEAQARLDRYAVLENPQEALSANIDAIKKPFKVYLDAVANPGLRISHRAEKKRVRAVLRRIEATHEHGKWHPLEGPR